MSGGALMWLNDIRTKWRLWRIENALGIKLRPDQLDYVLKDDYSILLGERCNGKSTAVQVKIVLFQEKPLDYYLLYGNAGPLYVDPDHSGHGTRVRQFDIHSLADMIMQCRRKGIKTCDIEFSPGHWIPVKKESRADAI